MSRPLLDALASNWFYLLAAASVVYLVKNYYQKGLSKYPGPFIASLTDFWRLNVVYHRRPEREYRRLHDKHGDIVRLGPNMLSFSNPEAIKTIYGLNKGFTKSDFYPVQMAMAKGRPLESMFGTTNEDYHSNMRRSVSSAFSMSTIVRYESRVNETSHVFLDQTEQRLANTGEPVDFVHWLQLFAFDVITEVTYSKRQGFVDRCEDVEGIMAGLDRWFKYAGPTGQVPWLDKFLMKNPILSWLDKWGLMENTSPVAQFSKARIDERMRDFQKNEKSSGEQGVEEPSDLLTAFLKAKRDRPDFFDDRRILIMATSISLAGSDTTAISLAAVFYHLLKNPRCHQKLKDELEKAAQDGIIPKSPLEVISWSSAQKLPYLDSCIKEAFRMHPAIGFILERVVPHPGATICDEFIPGGTIVGCNAWVIHKRKEIFGEDVDVYRPERWQVDTERPTKEEEERIKLMSATLFQFGAGSRTCLGRHISLLEMYKIIPSFLRRFDVRLVNPEKECDLHNAWFIKQIGFNVFIESATKEQEKV